jgi:dipeptidase
VCDTLCVVGSGHTLFAKSSDRPPSEPQVVEAFPRRPAGGVLRTQYLELADTGAHAMLGSRPAWLWGFEHGVNEHGVAIGNERVETIDDPRTAPPALIGMDLVRLGLERAASADEAVAVITSLLAAHGQGGIADAEHDEPYWSSFLVADATGAWVLETSGRTWVAKAIDHGAAISNRITLGADWTRASDDVPAGADFDTWRDPNAWTRHADVRLAATRACVATTAAALTPADIVGTLRHHGDRPWGAPGTDPGAVDAPPDRISKSGHGITVCMHVRDYMTTNASMVAELPDEPAAPLRAWVALGSPCASVYLPVFPPAGVPAALARESTWARFAALARRVEADGAALATVRAELGPLEAELWAEAGMLTPTTAVTSGFTASSWARVDAALTRLGV